MSASLIFEVFTLFPEVFKEYLHTSILDRAQRQGFVSVNLYNFRDWTADRHHITDDVPYGGGGGMIMKPEPIFAAVEAVLGTRSNCPVILLTPQGRIFNNRLARELASLACSRENMEQPQDRLGRIGIICGRYEGVDERVRENLITDEISIGDYVLTGGELAAMVLIDAVTRYIPGVLGDPQGVHNDSFEFGLLEYPQYTRPAQFRGLRVPEILLSGDHARIARWRREQSLKRTNERRPDLLKSAVLSKNDLEYLESLDAST